MSDEDIASSPGHTPPTKEHVVIANDHTTNAFPLLSTHLDNALEQQKNEIVSVLKTTIPALNSSNTSNQNSVFLMIECLRTFLLSKRLLWLIIGS